MSFTDVRLWGVIVHFGLVFCSLFVVLPLHLQGIQTDAEIESNTLVMQSNTLYSNALGYKVGYQVFRPQVFAETAELQATGLLLIFDAESALRYGKLESNLEALLPALAERRTIAVLLSSREVNNPQINRRESEYLGNPQFRDFCVNELLPHLKNGYSLDTNREQTVVMGISYGATGAADLVLNHSDVFGRAICFAPIVRQTPDLLRQARAYSGPLIEFQIYVGIRIDATNHARALNHALRQSADCLTSLSFIEGHHHWHFYEPYIQLAILNALQPLISHHEGTP